MKITTKYIAVLLTILLSAVQATANKEICTDRSGRVKVVLQRQTKPNFIHNLKQIELYQDGKLLATDYGPFSESFCHVRGSIQKGRFFSYVDCDRPGPTKGILSWDKYFRPIDTDFLGQRLDLVTFDLANLDCVSSR